MSAGTGLATSQNLIFHIDMDNPRSFKGSASTNLVYSGNVHGWPTIGNGWGTYNTNQYNGGSYFSIGAIALVSGNMVTTATAHPLRTYDVVTPQTTGGGVTAGTNYVVRKWSSTTFSLHSYNGSQDGSAGLSVLDSIHNDTRISINSVSFPTSWWGPPHLPNAGLIKQVIPNGFNHRGKIHDCLRMYYYRPDGVKDAIAYGVYPAWVAGNNYTTSFWYRAATPNAVGTRIDFSRWTNGNSSGASFNLGATWQKFDWTTANTQTAGTNYYWFDGGGPTMYAWDIAEISSYVGSTISEYSSSDIPRTSTQEIIDLTGNYVCTPSNLVYTNTSATLSESGASTINTNLPLTTLAAKSSFTLEVWMRITAFPTAAPANGYGSTTRKGVVLGATYYSGTAIYWTGNSTGTSMQVYGFIRGDDAYRNTGLYSMSTNTYYHVVVTNDQVAGTLNLYINGDLYSSTTSATLDYNAGNAAGAGNIGINRPQVDGGGTENYSYINGTVNVAKVYTRALTASDVKQNFAALRGRFGI